MSLTNHTPGRGAFLVLLILTAMTACVPSAQAWNNYGHMSVAYVAYQNLTPQVRDKANGLLVRNPDFPEWLKSVPGGLSDAETNLMVFMVAATWADRIKFQSGFSEDDPAHPSICNALSDQNVGFTDHLRHRCWHFIDVAVTQDNASPLPSTPVPNAKERVDKFRLVLGGTNEDLKAYDLSWVLHLVGDLHQPLHCVTRVGQSQLNGDQGGNLVSIVVGNSSNNLHSFWDDLLGPSKTTPHAVIETAKKLPKADPTKAADLNVSHWVDEGLLNATNAVYVSPIGLGEGSPPFTISSQYQQNATELAKQRVALAGERLANLLNAELK